MERPGRFTQRAPRSGDERSAIDGSITTAEDPFLRALETLDGVLADETARQLRMRRRIAVLRAERAAGRNYSDIIADEPRPRLVEMLAEATRELDSAGAVVRRTEARALHDAGMTMDEIADWFGVTRQRVSALLRDR